MRIGMIATVCLALAACGPAPQTQDADAPVEAPSGHLESAAIVFELPTLLDCFRENRGVLIAAHRGGPAPGLPENALETMAAGLADGLRVFEIDVAESRDGVLFLMHDRTLGRTTTGSGAVADTDWTDIARLRLIDNAGTLTDFSPPRLTDVLVWAKANGAILELDRKDTTSFRNILASVRAAEAEANTILISYNDDQAAEIAGLAPDIMMTASAFGARDVDELERRGVDPTRLIAWTGTREPDPAAFARLEAIGVEPAFGTLGRPGQRLDDAWLADGDASEFVDLVESGLVLLATDAPRAVAAALDADDRAWAACTSYYEQ